MLDVSTDIPPENYTLARTFNCAVMGPTEEVYDQKTPYQGADHRRVEVCTGQGQCSGPVPEARHLGRGVLYVADNIRLPGSQQREECEEAAPTG